MLWARAVLMQQPASGRHVWTGAGFGGADGGTTWKPCIQKEQRAEGWGQPTAHRWKGEGCVGRGRCVCGGGYNVWKSCTVLPNTKQLITAQKMCQLSWAFHTQKTAAIVKTGDMTVTEDSVFLTKITPPTTKSLTNQWTQILLSWRKSGFCSHLF